MSPFSTTNSQNHQRVYPSHIPMKLPFKLQITYIYIYIHHVYMYTCMYIYNIINPMCVPMRSWWSFHMENRSRNVCRWNLQGLRIVQAGHRAATTSRTRHNRGKPKARGSRCVKYQWNIFCIYIYICLHVYLCIYIYMCVCMCMYVCVYM